VFGHDFGSPVAAWSSLLRPDVFKSVAMMSAPFAGPPPLPFDTANKETQSVSQPVQDIHAQLAALKPPRKHYWWYYSTREANANMQHASQGLHAFLRAYYHYKSADWKENKPFRLQSWSAGELAKMPTYYIMELDKGMAENVAPHMPSAAEIAKCAWLPDDELAVYTQEYARLGFQGGLQWYRCRTDTKYHAELQVFSHRTIDVPSCFIGGKSDWGTYQKPGDFERMQDTACSQMVGCHLVDGAGHWVQQEQPERVSELLLRFLKEHK
jgi:pimeloyl-ACP methyl ester carboxylesterase